MSWTSPDTFGSPHPHPRQGEWNPSGESPYRLLRVLERAELDELRDAIHQARESLAEQGDHTQDLKDLALTEMVLCDTDKHLRGLADFVYRGIRDKRLFRVGEEKPIAQGKGRGLEIIRWLADYQAGLPAPDQFIPREWSDHLSHFAKYFEQNGILGFKAYVDLRRYEEASRSGVWREFKTNLLSAAARSGQQAAFVGCALVLGWAALVLPKMPADERLLQQETPFAAQTMEKPRQDPQKTADAAAAELGAKALEQLEQ